ncbi:Scr1 family TA system antitoxin-like transcriptional regulator, partial [Streptomyces sp. NPDC002677]|uniref:helix-turn-helix domain-containing protein n=1 Tax=Streptomyces sp. NPDC002677 TaxID=3154774 RepID=UPI00332F6698
MRPICRPGPAVLQLRAAYAGPAYAVTHWTVLVTGRDHGGWEVAYVGDGVEPESSDSLRTFGAVLQALREHAGLSREEFAEQVRFSKHTVASVELGRRMPDESLVEASEGVLGNTGALRRAAGHVARQPGLAAWFRQWARMEATAINLYTYECRVVPGLLQTEQYTRAVSLSMPPIPNDQELDDRVAARIARQELLSTRRERPC